MGSARVAKSLPLQVAAICYRRRGSAIEFSAGQHQWRQQVDIPQGLDRGQSFS